MIKLRPTQWALVTALAMTIASVVCFYAFHLPENGSSQYLIIGIYVAGIVLNLRQVHLEEKVAIFKDYFSEGFKHFVLITLIMVFYSWIFYQLNPQIMEQGISDNNEMLLQQGNKTAAEIASNADQLRKIFMPVMISLTTIKYLFLGALATIVTTLFLMRKKQAA